MGEIKKGDLVVEIMSEYDDWKMVYYNCMIDPQKISSIDKKIISEKSYMIQIIFEEYSKIIVIARIENNSINGLKLWIRNWDQLSEYALDLDNTEADKWGYKAHEYIVNTFALNNSDKKFESIRKRPKYEVVNISIGENGEKIYEVDDGHFQMMGILRKFNENEVIKYDTLAEIQEV